MVRNSRAEADPGGAADSRCSSDRPDAEGGFTSEKETLGQNLAPGQKIERQKIERQNIKSQKIKRQKIERQKIDRDKRLTGTKDQKLQNPSNFVRFFVIFNDFFVIFLCVCIFTALVPTYLLQAW
jgi:hypothetical protein